MSEDPTKALLRLEQARCDYIVRQDFSSLRELLSSQLVHTHTRGNQDTRESYLEYLTTRIEILDMHREKLHVQWLGSRTAVMHGQQISRARLRGTIEEVCVEAQVLQVWTQEPDGHWRQVAFQATPLGSAPPPVVR